MHAGRYGCRVQTTADSVSDEAELLVRGEYAKSSDCRHDHYKLSYEGTGMHGLGALQQWAGHFQFHDLSQFCLTFVLPLR